MGCSNSKGEDNSIVSLCRQRRDLIRAAADRRYDFAAAHSSYFRALDRVGDALHRFVTEELTAVSSPLPSPLLTLPPSDGKAKSKSDRGSIFHGNGNGNGVGGSRHLSSSPPSSASSISLSYSGSGFSHSHLPEEENVDPHSQRFGPRSEPQSDRGFGQEHFSSFVNPDYYADPVTGVYGYRYPHIPPQDRGQFSSYLNPNYNFYPNQFTAFPNPDPNPNPNYYYMKKSTTIPSTFYMDPNVGSNGYANFYTNDMNLTSRDERENVADSNSDRAPPPPPPAPEGSGWDFFNVFDTYDQFLMDFKGRLRSGSPSTSSSPGSSEIRAKEGIPDLEEETETESFREVAGSGIGYSKTVPFEEIIEEKTIIEEKVSGRDENQAFVGKKGANFEQEDLTNKEGSCSGSSLRSSSLVMEENGVALHGKGTKGVVEAVEEIKEQFKWASMLGEEVARLLEGGKQRYRSRRTLLKVVFCRILDSLALSALASLGHSPSNVRHPDANMLEMNDNVSFDYINIKSTNLSATLEKLYVWENKLYKEVKDEEKLRIVYEKECRRLKALDDGGAESARIDSTRAAIRKLVTKISIAIKSVDAISRRIHKLRDEELRPQLIELILGLMTMWNSMLACHQKQFQSIAESKCHNLTSRVRNQRTSVAEATMELEIELRNWSSCFRNWISTQKAYIEALNGWLMNWLLHEQEETPDGVIPFSPSRIGAPTIFVVSNDLHHALERISEVGVKTAMHIFADNVHELWESQNEEQRQKLKAEYLSRDFSRRLGSLNKESGFVDVLLDKRPVSPPNGDDYHKMIGLDAMRKRLDDETAKHQEIIRNVQEAASSSLQMGLVPIFEALRNYTNETLKAYEGIRIPINNREGT